MKKWKMFTLTTMVATGMIFSGIAAEASDTKVPDEITLYTYYSDSAKEVLDLTLEKLKDIYPDLKVNIEHRTDSDGQVLKTRAAVGELPDVFECIGTLTDILQQSGDLVMLDDAMKEYGLEEKYLEGNLEAERSADGHFYAVQETQPQNFLVYYNTDVFEKLNLEEPTNFEEFKNVVKTLADNDIIPLALFGQQKWPGLQLFDLAVIGEGQYGGITALDDGTASITDPEYLAAAEKVSELIDLGLIGSGALNTNASQAFELLGTGQAGMLVNGSWFFNDAITGGWSDHVGYFHYNPFADAEDAEEVQWHMSGGTGGLGGYAVSTNGEYAEFCTEFLMDFTYYHSIASAEHGSVSALKEKVDPDETRPEAYQDYADHISDIKSTTKFEWTLDNQAIMMALEDDTELLNTAAFTAEDFIADLETLISEAKGE